MLELFSRQPIEEPLSKRGDIAAAKGFRSRGRGEFLLVEASKDPAIRKCEELVHNHTSIKL